MIAKLSKLALGLSLVTASTLTFAESITFDSHVKQDTDTLVLFYGENGANTSFKNFDKQSNGQLTKAIKAADFKGKYSNTIEVLAPNNIDYQRIVVIGTGNKALSKSTATKLGGNLSAKLEKSQIKTVTVAADDLANNAETAALIAHGINLRAYRFENYFKEKRHEKSFYFDVDNAKATRKAYKPLSYIESGVFLARDLTSETPTEMTPVDFAKAAKELKKYGVKITVFNPKQLKKLGMGALEAVGRGSSEGARLVVAHYKNSDEAPIAIAGKGITFDSGGYNIKTHSSIVHMKSDMAGAAAALGTVKALAMGKEKVNVVAVMGMAANMVSENSVAPGDVLTTAQGLTVEITNTDAEGRLVLTDAMWYAREKFNPRILIDVATLTGSKVRAVGNEYAAVFSEDDNLVKQLTMAGKEVNENLWRLPLGYKSALKSGIADLRNTGSSGPGATTAATFLQQFAGDTKWAHIDIAGNALASSSKGEVPKGGTGFGVRLLTEWILENK
ncbi:leucyl aminopeptidase [Parashewanella curva]|uniref:Probable cytosol aminopeptidase n=1 Tax=Parashewanella curva TaxID=2338552 RepID=A0A3L8PVQ2_9GAMM|nr:leucyl aminopeptidase [Parashewanella curva]RLV59421.1 leucyl aminopeptidase [Parashewanella curva]